MRLLLRKQSGLFSKDYELRDKDSVICFMQFDDWKNASLLIEGKYYSVRANGELDSGGERNLRRWFSKTRHRSSINVDGEFRYPFLATQTSSKGPDVTSRHMGRRLCSRSNCDDDWMVELQPTCDVSGNGLHRNC